METAKIWLKLIANPKFKLSENYDNIFTTTNNSRIIFSFQTTLAKGPELVRPVHHLQLTDERKLVSLPVSRIGETVRGSG